MANTLARNNNNNSCFFLIKRPRPITHSSQQQQHTINYNSLVQDSIKSDNNNNNNVVPFHTTNTLCFVSAPAPASTDYVEANEVIVPGMCPATPDLTTAAYDWQRFFISSPGQSNTIVDSKSPSSSSSTTTASLTAEAAEVAGGVPVLIYSADPYMDFRRSMQEMVESRDLGNLKVKQVWEYLQELLLSYLALNPNNTHQYIVRAFTDLVVSIMSPN